MLLEICVAAKSPEKLRDTPIQKWYWSDSSLLCVSMSIRAVKRKCKLLSMNHESKARAACLSMSQHIMSCNFPPLKMTHQVWKRALFSESAWVYRWGAFKIHDSTGYAVKLCSEVEMVLRKGELTIIYMNIINVEHVCIFLSLSLSVVLVCLCPPFERAGLIRQSNRICAYTAAWCSILLYVIACWKPRTKTSKQYKGIQRALWILFDSSQFVFHDPVLMIHPGKTLEALQEPLHKNHKSNSRSQSIWLPQQGGHSHMVYTEGYLLIQSKRTRC